MGARERQIRFSMMASLSMWANPNFHASKLFLSHIMGLDAVRGRVLEIGGSDQVNLSTIFKGCGAEYVNIRLEGNPRGDNRVIVGDFMGMETRPFDMIISLGVFEEGGIDRNQDTHCPLDSGMDARTNAARLLKLHGLLADCGSCVIGTISAPCLFSGAEIASAGFILNHRQGPFYTFMRLLSDIYLPNDPSELLMMQKSG